MFSGQRSGRSGARSASRRGGARLDWVDRGSDRFDGWSLAADKPLTGAWRNPESGQVEYDDSWRYEIGIAPSRLADLDAYLAQLAHRLGQKALWRVAYAGGEGKVIPARAPAKR